MDYRADLALALDGDGRTDEALAVLQEALAREPGHADLHLAMGTVMLGHGRFEEALEHGSRAIQANPQLPAYRFVHARALASLGRLGEAERAVLEVLAARGDVPTVRAAAQAETHADARRYIEALAAALEGDPAAIDARIGALVERCHGRRQACLAWAAAVRARAGQGVQMYALLAQLEEEPAYRPNLGDWHFRRWYADPRYRAHLARYGRAPPLEARLTADG